MRVKQPHPATIKARMHPVAVELDFVEPLIAFRSGVDELCELRRDPFWRTGAGPPG